MKIIVNGQEQNLTAECRILEFLDSLNLDPSTLILELNAEVIPADLWGQTTLHDGDHLEVLRLVGGG